jgi:hypothetical protein
MKKAKKVDPKQELVRRVTELGSYYDGVLPFDSEDEHYLQTRINAVRVSTRKEMAAAVIQAIEELWPKGKG